MFDQYIEEEQISQNLLNNGYIIQLSDKISQNSCLIVLISLNNLPKNMNIWRGILCEWDFFLQFLTGII